MQTTSRPVAIAGCLLLVSTLLTPAHERASLKDFTNIKLDDLGIKPVEPKKDAKTGFIVGGKNPTSLVKSLAEINGKSIAELEKQMRPGAPGLEGSGVGFLGKEERLLDVLANDNRFVVDERGLTHQELAKHLHVLAAIGGKYNNREFLYHGRRFKVTGMDRATVGSQYSPFFDRTQGNQAATVINLDKAKRISYSLLVPHMIERYGFYEGKKTSFRVEPRRILEVVDFLEKK